jgi:N-acetylglucosamine kinase-like BadF-type ATPase
MCFLKVMCLSGAGSKASQQRLHEEFNKLGVSYKIIITNDAFAAALTAYEKGAVVLISGTGSNCVHVETPDTCLLSSIDQIEYFNVGGLGNSIGDEGSGFYCKLIN